VIPVGWDEVERLELGRLEPPPGGAPEHLTGIKADSRVVGPGDLFVALNTGVAYVAEAAAKGAATLVPRDQEAALASLAALVRSKSSARVVAVVGSTGKTSTKDILGAFCSAAVATVFAEASQNNEIGLPLTVCRLEPETAVLVTEMGMRGLGQIAELCAVARPDVALVTSIGPEHLELVGTVERVAEANAEAVAALPPGGIAVVPADAPELEPYLGRDDVEIRRFDRRSVERVDDTWRFPLRGRDVSLRLPFSARHMAENALAALTVYEALGLPLDETLQCGADTIRLSRWRGEEVPLPDGGIVINDAYNANPTSMRAALLDLVERAGDRRRVAILGEMAELGDGSWDYHDAIGTLVDDLGIELVIAIGDEALPYVQAHDSPGRKWIPDADSFGQVAPLLRPGDAILVKASRAVGLEGIPASIQKAAAAWSESS
jgi:UDP-N-acetylmuramoyl-tripeptide--D-alanyl-D-alanine ligase